MNVLKKVLFLLLISSFCSTLIAQISLGVRGGITLPDITISEQDGYYYEGGVDYLVFMGTSLGAVLEIKLHKNFAIQPEIMLVQKGTKVDFPDYYYSYYYYSGFTEETKLRLNYLEVPILAKGIIGNESVTGYAAVGPTLGYAASGYLTELGEKMTLKDEDWDGFTRFELGASFGGGVGLSVGNGQAFLDLRYLLGFTNIIDDTDIKVRNRAISISVGYLADLN